MATAMSKKDQDALAEAGKAWNAATTDAERQAAHAQAEAIRAKYGYSGGADGSKYISTSSGKKTSDDKYMSQEDYDLVSKYGDDWNAAKAAGDTAGMQAAHDAAEALRKKYNYSGGIDGSEYIQLGERIPYEKPEYVNRYQDLIDQLLGQIVDRDPFSYDYRDDPLWKQLQSSYTMEGQRAMQNAIGQASARTGGMASSYAASAANQANNYYMAQLNGKIPELQQLAYSMYQDDLDKDRLNLQMIQALEQEDYAKYQDLLGQYNTDREWEYQMGRDQILDDRYDREWDYQVGRDQIGDKRYEQELAYQQAMDRWKLSGKVSAADAGILGVPAGTPYGMYTAATGSSSGSKSTSSRSGVDKPTLTAAQTLAALKDGVINDTTLAAYRYYYGEDYAGAEGDGTGDSSLSGAGQNLYYQLQAIPGLTMDNKVAMIEDALNHGRITDSDADWLLDYLGY